MGLRMGITLLAVLLFANVAVADELRWRLVKDQDQVQVYLAEVQGSRYQAYRGVTLMRVALPRLLAMQEDVSGSCAWVYACAEQRLLSSEGDLHWLYTRLYTPWPVKGRDSIVKVTTETAADGSVTRNLQGEPGYLPEQGALVRVSKFEGFWRMQPRDDGLVEVTYQAHTEPGGRMPAWLANTFVVDVPFHTLQAMRQLAEQP